MSLDSTIRNINKLEEDELAALGQEIDREGNVIVDSKKPEKGISRRKFLELSSIGVVNTLLPWKFRIEGREDDINDVKPENKEFSLDQLQAPYLAHQNELISTSLTFVFDCARFFSDRLKRDRVNLTLGIIGKIFALPEDQLSQLKPLLPGSFLDSLLANKDAILASIEDSETESDLHPLVNELFTFLSENPNTYGQLAFVLTRLSLLFDELEPRDSKILFALTQNNYGLVPEGVFKDEVDYVYRKPLNRYESDDEVENYELKPEIQAILDEASDKFGIPSSVIASILVMEGGGGVNAPGAFMSLSAQDYFITHNYNHRNRILDDSNNGGEGPAQASPTTFAQFKYAGKLIWPECDYENINNLKTSVGIIAAKLYVDALAFFYANRYYYTSEYGAKVQEYTERFYNVLTGGMQAASDETGLQQLLDDYSKMRKKDLLYILHATVSYHGSNTNRYTRLGMRTYDEFAAAYYYSSINEDLSTRSSNVLDIENRERENIDWPDDIRGNEAFFGNDILITIDDCYDIEFTRRMVLLMKEKGVRATFFPNTQYLDPTDDAIRALWRDIYASGFDIGYHTVNHRSGMTQAELREDLAHFEDQISTLLGIPDFKVKFVRPPEGNWNNDWMTWVHENNLTNIRWNFVPSARNNSVNYFRAIMENPNGGRIVLLHPREFDSNWLADNIDALKALAEDQDGNCTSLNGNI